MRQNNGTRQRSRTRTKGGGSGWQELGDFIVSFGYAVSSDGERRLETKIHYSQGDRSMRWAGAAKRELLEWIDREAETFLPVAAEAALAREPEPERAPEQKREPEREPEPEHEPQLERKPDPVRDPETDPESPRGRSRLSFEFTELSVTDVRSERPNTLRAHARLRITTLEPADPPVRYATEILLTNLETLRCERASLHADRLVPGEWLRAIVCDFPVPEAGRYEVNAIIRPAPNSDQIVASRKIRLKVED